MRKMISLLSYFNMSNNGNNSNNNNNYGIIMLLGCMMILQKFSWYELLVVSAFSSSSSSSSSLIYYSNRFHDYECRASGNCRFHSIPHVLYSKKKSSSQEDDNNRKNNNMNSGGGDDERNEEEKKQVDFSTSNGKKRKKNPPKNSNILEILDPYKAGKKLREKLDTALTTLNAATSSSPVKGLSTERRAIYYLDDRISDNDNNLNGKQVGTSSSSSSLVFAERNPLLDSYYSNDDDYIPEVLVVGATGEVGRLVVRRLMIDGRFRVRVLVRDLYSDTLNMLGTGVTYCQGDLSNMDSLEYALTDVDKIVFCAGPPKPDETDYSSKLEQYATETLHTHDTDNDNNDNNDDTYSWDQMESIRTIRAQLAEQVDCLGMQNLVRAYQNVRHADYGTSQAAKRSLFKFQSRPGDFNLFAIDDSHHQNDNNAPPNNDPMASDDNNNNNNNIPTASTTSNYNDNGGDEAHNNLDQYYENNYQNYNNNAKSSTTSINNDNYYEQMNEIYADYYDSDNDSSITQNKPEEGNGSKNKIMKDNNNNNKIITNRVKTGQASWIKNKFGHGVFVGRVPTTTSNTQPGGKSEASIVTSRLRSRDDPDAGIDLSNGFSGFVMRVCADGKNYECFIRTQEYYDDQLENIEYVCPFTTIRKLSNNSNKNNNNNKSNKNKSFNKFTTIRLPFSKFKRRPKNSESTNNNDFQGSSDFDGKDIRQIGFRIRGEDNTYQPAQSRFRRQSYQQKNRKFYNNYKYVKFYLAISYIKVYRSQPEPEFIYLSDSRIPPTIKKGMVRHDLRQILDNVNNQQTNNEGANNDEDSLPTTIFDEKAVEQVTKNPKDRSGEEVYFKYRGEEILRHSGLSYAIVRIAGYNELPSGESSSVYLQQSDEGIIPVSRADVAEVCVSALLDPNASNVCFYMTKKTGLKQYKFDDDLSEKFSGLEPDTV